MPDPSFEKGELFDELLETIGGYVLKGGNLLQSFRDQVLSKLDHRLSHIAQSVGDEGIDPFGMDPLTLQRMAVGAAFFYKLYFRCITTGLETIPSGPVILVANHGGQLPIDGVMITTALLLEGEPPRLARSMVDRWVPTLPFVSTLFSRVGVAVGTTENAERLLRRNEVLLVFPEGIEAIAKTIDQAYQLRPFGLGFMRLALSTHVPIVPVAVVGAEEQYPTLYNLKSVGKLFGLPSLPIWLQMIIPVVGLLPLPVRYRIHFGEPLHFDGDPDDPSPVLENKVNQVRSRIEEMLQNLRTQRKSIFW